MSAEWTRVAETVKRRRTDLGLSQRAAAFRATTSPTTWSSLETHGRPIDPLTKPKVARALGWTTDSIDRILRGEDPEVDGMIRPAPTLDDVDERISSLEDRFSAMEEAVENLIRRAAPDGPGAP